MNRLWIVALALSIAITTPAQLDRATAKRKLSEALSSVYGNGTHGINAAIVLPRGDAVMVAIGFGDPVSKKALAIGNRMPAGSVGKTFFLAAILQEVDAGRLDLDRPISAYVGKEPWFAGLPNANALTLRHLLQHTSGIPEHYIDPPILAELKANPDKVWGHSELLKTTAGKSPHFAAGKGWSYADTNFVVAALVLEKVTGQDAFVLIKKRILDRHGLKATIPSDSRTLPDLVPGLLMDDHPFGLSGTTMEGGRLKLNPQFEWAGGGFASTPLDLARWCKVLVEGRAFSASMTRQMKQGVAASTGRDHKYGLGLQIRPTPFGTTYGHGGWFPGYMAEIEYFADKRVSIAVQVNTDDEKRLGMSVHDIVVKIAEHLFTPGSN